MLWLGISFGGVILLLGGMGFGTYKLVRWAIKVEEIRVQEAEQTKFTYVPANKLINLRPPRTSSQEQA